MKTLEKILVASATFTALALAGCGGSTTTQAPPTTGGGTGGGTVNTGAANVVYVVQDPTSPGSAGTILRFPATASGSVSPSGTISVTAGTLLGEVATDALGNIYVAAATSSSMDVREYLSGATGFLTPVRLISSNATSRLCCVNGLAVNSAGEIVVGQDNGEIDSYSLAANGVVAPTRFILGSSQTGGGLSGVLVADQIAVDESDNIYVSAKGAPGTPTLAVFGPSASGNVAPARTFSSFTPQGLTTDTAGNLYVTTNTCSLIGGICFGSIMEFAPGASGSSSPTKTISGALTQTGNLGGIKVDSVGNIYVVSTSPAGVPSVLKFTAGVSGNVAPVSSFTSTAWTSPESGVPSLAVH